MTDYPFRFTVDYQTGPRSRGLAVAGIVFFVKALLLIPHLFVLFFVGIAAIFVIIGNFVVIIFTGSIPDWGVRWIIGVTTWQL